MTLRERIEATPTRVAMVALGACFTLSSIALLGDGTDHLRFFLPLAAFNAAVGILCSERVARIILMIELICIFVVAGRMYLQVLERFPNT